MTKKVEFPFVDRVPTNMVDNLAWRLKAQRRVLKEPDFANVLKETCAADAAFFINGFGWTYDPRRHPFSKLPFILFPFQKDALAEMLEVIGNEDLLIEKSRDMGASWLCLAALFHEWRFKDLRSFLLVSRVEAYVDDAANPKSLFWKWDFLLNNLPVWLRPYGYRESEHRRKMHIENPENGSVVDGESTNQNVARGDRRTAIVLDEFAAVEQGQRVLSATRDATNCRIFNSTPAGVNNAFYDMKQTGIRKLRLHWSIHPLKNRGLYTTHKDGTLKVLIPEGYPEGYHPILDGKLRSPWYDLECERAASPQEIAQEIEIDYLGSGYQFFNADSIERVTREYARPAIVVGDLEYETETGEPIRFREHPEGRIKLWCLLTKKGKIPSDHKIILGVDVSGGTGSSNSCLCGYSGVTNEKVLEYSNPYIRPEQFAAQAVAIARWLGNAYMIWEFNGPGRQFGSRVIELHYYHIYYRKKEEAISKKTSDVPGWASTKQTKLVLMGNYRDAIEKGKCINRSKEALDETLEYVFGANGSVEHSRAANKADPSGAGASHGDRVIADAMAWHGMIERQRKPKQKKPEIPIGCLAWRNQKREQKKQPKNRELSEGW